MTDQEQPESASHEPEADREDPGDEPEADREDRGDEPEADREDPGDQVPDVVESAAELGLGALIAPFTGGETVPIIGSVASMIEAGVDRLTHLGEHETTARGEDQGEDAADGAPDDGPE